YPRSDRFDRKKIADNGAKKNADLAPVLQVSNRDAGLSTQPGKREQSQTPVTNPCYASAPAGNHAGAFASYRTSTARCDLMHAVAEISARPMLFAMNDHPF